MSSSTELPALDDRCDGYVVVVAVCSYADETYAALRGAHDATQRLIPIFRRAGFGVVEIPDPSYDDIVTLSGAQWRAGGFRGPLVVVWTGHGARLDDELGLVVRDSVPGGLGKTHRPKDLARFARATGSTDTLIVLDTCSSGAGDAEVVEAAIRADNESTTAGRPPRVGVVVSCKQYEPAVDGAFLGAFADLLEDGPTADEVGVYAPLWSSSRQRVPAVALAYALEQRRFGTQSPRSWLSAGSDISFPNPCFVPGQPAGLVSDRLEDLAAHPPAEGIVSTPAIVELSERMARGDPGVWLLLGNGGSGKSTCLAEAARRHGPAARVDAADGLAGLQAAFAATSGPVLVDALDMAPFRELEAMLAVALDEGRRRFICVSSRPAALQALRPGAVGTDLIGVERVVEVTEAAWLRDAIVHYVTQRLEEAA